MQKKLTGFENLSAFLFIELIILVIDIA